MVSAGFYFRPHYVLLLYPVTAILAGRAVAPLLIGARSVAARAAGIALVLLPAGYAVIAQRDVLFELPPEAVSRVLFASNPFPESKAIADYVADRTSAAEPLLVLGSEPEISFLANRPIVTPHVHMYPLTEDQPYAAAMQEELIGQAESTKPRFVVYVNAPLSWLKRDHSPSRLFEWLPEYVGKHYRPEAVVDIPFQGVGTLQSFEDVPRNPPTDARVVIFRRID